MTCRREANVILQHMNLNKGETFYNFFDLVMQHSVICDKLDPKLSLREAPSDAAASAEFSEDAVCL